MTRYSPLLVTLHWLMAALILLALAAGKLLLSGMTNDDPQKVEGLGGHMSIGILIGLLLVLRLLTRFTSIKPAQAQTGNALLDRIGVLTHWAFYALIAGMVLSGLGMAFSAGLFPIVFGGSGEPLPANLNEIAPRIAHGVISTLLLALIILHIVAALYHQFILKDGLMRRMWFGRRTPIDGA